MENPFNQMPGTFAGLAPASPPHHRSLALRQAAQVAATMMLAALAACGGGGGSGSANNGNTNSSGSGSSVGAPNAGSSGAGSGSGTTSGASAGSSGSSGSSSSGSSGSSTTGSGGNATAFNSAGASVPGWPAYVAMGAVGGPNATAPTATSTGGNDDFGGRPVDVVFKYAGVNGNGDPGVVDPPTNAIRMTNDFNTLSVVNSHPTRVAIVEYTAQMSGGLALDDFTNAAAGASSANASASYLMARHFASLGADAMALQLKPVQYNGASYYGTLILNPDLMGAIEQSATIATVNAALPAGAVNLAVDQALCLLTNTYSYTNASNPNGLTNPSYLNKTYSGTPVQILLSLLNDGYPEWSLDGSTDPYWNSAIGNPGSQVGTWFNNCITNPSYDHTAYARPSFAAGFDGWVSANNWLIRAMAPQGTVSFGWQENMWAVGSGYWLHQNLSSAQITTVYAGPVIAWLSANAPSTVTRGASTSPDYFLFDRYESDDSAGAGQATLYNARSWDNYLNAVGQISEAFGKLPIMLWQIPGSHIPNTAESAPELYQNTPGAYAFSTAPVYFFGDSHLDATLSTMILGPSTGTINTAVGDFPMSCGTTAYNCLSANASYQQYLLEYNNQSNNYNWGIDNGKLASAAAAHVFAILWGGGNTTNVIKNFSNTDDHGWLAGKIVNYYQNPTPVVP